MNYEINEMQGTLVVLPASNDISATLVVRPRNTMQGEFRVAWTDESNLDSTVLVVINAKSELSSTLTVRVARTYDLNSSVDIKYRGSNDLEATVLPTTSNLLQATVNVRPHATAFGIFEIFEPPRITDTLLPTKDATTRSSNDYRYINYGKTSTMMVGNSSTETLRSFVEFDLSSYSKTLTAINAKIRLYYTGTLTNTDSLELWSTDRQWDETGITDANRPFKKDLITNTYTINSIQKFIEFDILDYVNDYLKNDLPNNGFTLISNKNASTDSFFTRESTLKPYLELTYFDTRVVSIGKSTVDATMTVYGASIQYLNATMTVKSSYGFSYLPATMYVHRSDTPVPHDKNAMFNISHPELNSTLKVVQTGNSDFSGTLTVAINTTKDMISKLNINRPELKSTMFLRYFDDVTGMVISRVADKSEITSKLKVNHPELKSILEVKYRNDLSASMTVQQNIKDDFTAFLTVNNNELRGKLTPRVLRKNELESTLLVYKVDRSEVKSKLNASNPELIGTLFVELRGTKDIDSTLLVYQNKVDELKATLITSQPELQATLKVMIVNEKESLLSVSNPELKSTVSIRVAGESTHNAFMYPRVLRAYDINSYLVVKNTHRSGAYYYIL